MAPRTTRRIDPSTEIRLVLYKNVRNSEFLIEKLKTGFFNCSFINPKLIVDEFQVAVAAYKATVKQKMTTKTIFTEIVFNLSPTRSITRSLGTFGLQNDSKSLLVVFVNDENDEEFEKIAQKVKGDEVGLEELKNLTDEKAICKEYEISEAEVEVGSLLDAVLGRMAIKDCL